MQLLGAAATTASCAATAGTAAQVAVAAPIKAAAAPAPRASHIAGAAVAAVAAFANLANWLRVLRLLLLRHLPLRIKQFCCCSTLCVFYPKRETIPKPRRDEAKLLMYADCYALGNPLRPPQTPETRERDFKVLN